MQKHKTCNHSFQISLFWCRLYKTSLQKRIENKKLLKKKMINFDKRSKILCFKKTQNLSKLSCKFDKKDKN